MGGRVSRRRIPIEMRLALGFAIFAVFAARSMHGQGITIACVPSTGPVEAGVFYTTTCTPSGGSGPYTFSISSGALPSGLGLSASPAASVTISGTPSVGSAYGYTLQATDTGSNTGNVSFNGTIAASLSFACTNNSVPAEINNGYTTTCTVTNGSGVAPFAWSISAGSLPSGINEGANCINTTACTLSGTAGSSGAVNYTLRVLDSAGVAATQGFGGTISGGPTFSCSNSNAPNEVGANYSTTCTANGGAGGYSWSISAGSLPTGVVLSPSGSSATISGPPGAGTAGSVNYTLQVADSAGTPQTSTQSFSGTIAAALGVSCNATGTPEVGATYSVSCSLTGGVAPYSWTTTGTVPAGITGPSPTGGTSTTVSGTFTTAQAFNFQVKATDTASTSVSQTSQSFSGTVIAAPTFSCTNNAGPNEVGSNYSTTCTASGGTAPYTWTISSGSIPSGVALSPSGSTATISGSPNSSAANTGFSYTLQLTDSISSIAKTQSFSGTVAAAPSLNCASSGTTEVGGNFSATCSTAGGVTPFSWAIVSGSLPSGLSLNASTGAVSGAFSATGSFSFAIQLTDSASTPTHISSSAFSGTVTAGPSYSCSTSTTLEVGVSYTLTCTAFGGTSPYSWSSNGLPGWLTLSPGGGTATISGTPASGNAGAFSYTLSLTDSAAPNAVTSSATQGGVVVTDPSVSCTQGNGPVEQGVSYSTSCFVSGGTGLYTWSIVSGSLPTGLALSSNGATATISGAPTSIGAYAYSIQATDSASTQRSGSQAFSGSVATALGLSCTNNAGPGGVNVPYTNTCTTSGGVGADHWSIVGSLPTGLTSSANGTTLTISGTPTVQGTFSYTVRVSDSGSQPVSLSQPYSGTIVASLSASCAVASGPVEQNDSYSNSCVAAGGAPPYSWRISSGALPQGISLTSNSNTAVISGAPSVSGAYAYTVQVQDSASTAQTFSVAFSGNTATALAFNCTNPAGPTEVNVAYNTNTCTVVSGTGVAPYSWSIVNSTGTAAGTSNGLPPGMAFSGANTSTFAISGTPTSVGNFTYLVMLTDSANSSNSGSQAASRNQLYSGSIVTQVAVSCTVITGPPEQNDSYSTTCTASGGTPNYTWVVVGGSLPAGVSLTQNIDNSNTKAIISGTPTGTGGYNYTLQVSDSAAPSPKTASQQYTGTVAPVLAFTCANTSGPTELTVPYTDTCTVTAGTGVAPYSWTVVNGGGIASGTANGLPPGLTSSGGTTTAFTVSGTPTATGNFTYRVLVTDSAANNGNSGAPAATQFKDFSGTVQTLVSMTCTALSGPVEQGDVYSTTCVASGGTPPYSWAISPGTLPNGLALLSSGSTAIISGAPTASGAFSYSLQVTDSASTPKSSTQAYSGTVVPTVAFTCTINSGPPEVNVNYTNTCTVTAGTGIGPFTWNVINNTGSAAGTSNGLPPGLTSSGANTNAFTISGKPSCGSPCTSAIFGYSVQVTDSASSQNLPHPTPQGSGSPAVSQHQDYSGQIAAPPSFFCTDSTGPVEDTLTYTTTCTGTNGTPPYSWMVTGLPAVGTTAPGISGTGTGGSAFVLGAGQTSQTATGQAIFITGNVITIKGATPSNFPASPAGTAFNFTLQMDDSYNPITSGQSLPTANVASQTFSGTTAPAPRISCVESGNDLLPTQGSGKVALGPAEAQGSNSSQIPNTQSLSYTLTCTASGGPANGTYKWNPTSGLPNGLTQQASGSTLTISGSPTASGSFPFTISFADQNNVSPLTGSDQSGRLLAGVPPSQPANNNFVSSIAAAPALTCNPTGGPSQAGIFYSTTCSVTGGLTSAVGGAYTWNWRGVNGTQPAGLTLTPAANGGATATLSGTPTVSYQGSYQVYVLDALKQAASVTFTTAVKSPLQLTCTSGQGPLEAGVSYQNQCTASGGTQPYTFSLTGAVPNGIVANPAGGNAVSIGGSPLGQGAYNYNVQVIDSAVTPCSGGSAGNNLCSTPQTVLSPNFAGTVSAAPTVTCDPNTAPPYQLGVPYTLSCQVTGGQSPYTWTVSGLPSGLASTPNASQVKVTGTPSSGGPYTFAVRATDALGAAGQISETGIIGPVLAVKTSGSGTFVAKGQAAEGTGTVAAVVNNASSTTITGTVAVTMDLSQSPGIALLGSNPTVGTDPSWTCTASGEAVTCTRTDALAPQGAFPPVMVNVSVSDQACAGTAVAASVQLNGQSQNSTGATVTAAGCLTIAKTHGSSFQAGAAPGGTYTLNVSNGSATPLNGTITVTDTLNPSLSIDPTLQQSQNGWTCNAAQTASGQPWTLTCTYAGGAPPNTALPAIAVPVDVAAGGCGLVSDTAVVRLGNLVESSAKDPTSISGNTCLNVTGMFAPPAAPGPTNTAPAGSTGTYTVAVSNIGEAPIADPITLTVTLPAGLSVAASNWTDATWSCDVGKANPTGDGTTLVTCTNTPPFASGADPTLSIFVSGTLTAGCSIANAQAQAAWDSFTSPNPQLQIPASTQATSCFTLARSDPPTIAAGASGSYTLTVGNPTTAGATVPSLEVTETLPAGISLASAAGTGWDCSKSGGQNIDCLRSDSLTSYPPITINFNVSTTACSGFTSTAYLSVNGAQQALSSDSMNLTGCFTLTESVPAGGFNIGQQGASYTLAVAYLGQNSISGTLSVQQTLPGGLVPTGFTAPDGTDLTVAGNADGWVCSIPPGSGQTFTCTRSAAGTYVPINVAVNVGVDACPATTTQASLQLDATQQTTSNSPTIPIVGTCPGTLLTLAIHHDTNPPGGVFTPGSQATYTLVVTNTSASQASGTVTVTSAFSPGLTPGSAINAPNWTSCQVQGLTVSCTRSDALGPGQQYDVISIPVTVDANACPVGTDTGNLTLAAAGASASKTQSVPAPDTVNLHGCITISPSPVSFPAVTLGGSAATPQQVTLIALDKAPLNITIHQLPATSVFSISGTATSCPQLASGQDCPVTLSQSNGLTLNVAYNPACIGTQNDSILYDYSFTDVTGGAKNIKIPLTGQAVLQSLSLVQLPGGDPLTNGSTVQPASPINLGLNPTPGYCVDPNATLTPTISLGQVPFQGANDSTAITYDESVGACPSGTSGCIATLAPGTVAGVINLNATFQDSNGNDVGYPGANAQMQLTVPQLPPALTAVSKGTVTSSSFQISVTGYSTPRQNTQTCFNFTAAQGAQLDTTGLNNCYAEQDIANWYDRTSSQKTGSQFTTAVTFSFSGDPNAIGRVDTWLKNDLGESNHYCLDFRSATSTQGACQ